MFSTIPRWIWSKHLLWAFNKQSANWYATVASMQNKLIKLFDEKCISEPHASAEYIIAHALGRQTLSGINMNRYVTESELTAINSFCSKRLKNMPIQYVIGEWDFGELNLKMKPSVFIPRPETQGLVDAVIEDINASTNDSFQLLEVGCGSGAITLSLLHACNQKVIFKQLQVTAIDKSSEAVELTKENAFLTSLKNFELLQCDVQSTPLDRQFDGIVSNPPYIPTKELLELQPEISLFENSMALDGGEDGLDTIKKIVAIADNLLSLHGWIWLEVDTTHPELLQNLFKNFEVAQVRKDFLEKDRFVKLVKVS